MKEPLGFRATGRKVICGNDTFELREAITPYGKANNLDSGNTFLWNQEPPSLIGQFLHKNWSIKTEILLFLRIFYSFFNMLPWPYPRTSPQWLAGRQFHRWRPTFMASRLGLCRLQHSTFRSGQSVFKQCVVSATGRLDPGELLSATGDG